MFPFSSLENIKKSLWFSDKGALGRKGLIEFKLCDVKMTSLKVEMVPNDET